MLNAGKARSARSPFGISVSCVTPPFCGKVPLPLLIVTSHVSITIYASDFCILSLELVNDLLQSVAWVYW